MHSGEKPTGGTGWGEKRELMESSFRGLIKEGEDYSIVLRFMGVVMMCLGLEGYPGRTGRLPRKDWKATLEGLEGYPGRIGRPLAEEDYFIVLLS